MEPEHPEFRVTKLQIQNFKSCRSTTVELGDFTCLVGPNNSGKTNILESMRFLRIAFTRGLENAIQEFGGIERLRHFGAGEQEPMAFTVEARHGEREFHYSVRVKLNGGIQAEPALRGSP